MADEFETLREVTHGIKGFRTEVRLYVAGFVFAFGVMGWVMSKGFDKIDNLEASNARMEALLSTLVSDSQQIKKNTSLASIAKPEPTADSFNGWIGVQAEKELDTVPALADDKYKDAWIYLPAK